MSGYRDDDQTVGYCPVCGQPQTAPSSTVGGKGYCELHGWRFADWHSMEQRNPDEYEYLRMEQKLDEAGLL